MLLQMNSSLSPSLRYSPLHQGSGRKLQSPLAHCMDGLVHRGSHSKKPSSMGIKCSAENPFDNSSNKIGSSDQHTINRNYKPLNKPSTVALASQDGFVSKSEDISTTTSFLQLVQKKFDALYRLTRPYTWASIVVGILSVALLSVRSVSDLTPMFLLEVFKSMVPAIMMNNFVNAINQLSDVEIDKVNKPNLPLASGDFSIPEGIAIAIASPMMGVAMGMLLQSPPLVMCFLIWWVVGAAYSIDLPYLRWKGSPLMAAVTIITLNGLLLQFPYFVHFQKYVLGISNVVFPKSLLFAAVIMAVFNVAIAFSKDLPDVEGDTEFGLRTLPIILGREKVFSIVVNMVLAAYGGAVLVGATSSNLLCRLVTIVGHSALAAIFWKTSQTIDLKDPKSMQAYYMFIFKLYYAEFILMHFVR